MSTEHQEVPFLLEQADRVPHNVKADGCLAKPTDTVETEWFHTRCGHPRARDD